MGVVVKAEKGIQRENEGTIKGKGRGEKGNEEGVVAKAEKVMQREN